MTGEATYPTRVDAWLVALLALSFGAVIVQGFALASVSTAAAAVSFSVAVLMVALVALLGVPCRYTLAADHLLVRFGVARIRIAYVDITDVEPSRSPVSGPAWSLSRVRIGYGGRRSVLVSPRDREGFIAALHARVAQARARSAGAGMADNRIASGIASGIASPDRPADGR